jgi:hypothetical protein
MPAKPKVGDVYRPENIPGLVFEEVGVKAVDETVDGPHGPVAGAIVAGELHQDGSREDKVFAPGYGEFSTASGGDVEAMTLAVPADKLPGSPPAELETLSAGADGVFKAVSKGRWTRASATVRTMIRAWRTLQRDELPPRLGARMSLALKELGRVVAARDATRALRAAIAVAQGSLDLQLRHRSPTAIDRARFELWVRQLIVDAAAGDAAGVRGDLATLEWIRDRFVHTLARVANTRVNAHLLELRTHVSDDALGRAAREAQRLRSTLAVLRPVS